MMERQVGQLVRLVDDLLDVSRISHGQIELRRERIELASAVHRAVELVATADRSDGPRADGHVAAGTDLLDADATRLAQVIGNLLNNASKFTRSRRTHRAHRRARRR